METKPRRAKKPSYLAKRKTKKNFNLDIQDIQGTQPKTHFRKLEERINRAKGKRVTPQHTCGHYNPYAPSTINLKQEVDEACSNILEVDYKNLQAKKGNTQIVETGKFIKVKGQKRYLDTTNKNKFMAQRRDQKNKVQFFNDLSKSTDKVIDPDNRKDKYIKRSENKRRDCSADYKFQAKPMVTKFLNKRDLRFDVDDINQKEISFVPQELKNDIEYQAYLEKLQRAKKEGYLPEFSSRKIDRFAMFDRGRRVWRSNSNIELQGISNKRSVSPTRSVSRTRAPISRSPIRNLSKPDNINIKPYNTFDNGDVYKFRNKSPGNPLNNNGRYNRIKKPKVDYFPRPNKLTPREEEKFRRPSGLQMEDKKHYQMRAEMMRMVNGKNTIIRDRFKPLNKDLMGAMGFVSANKRHLRSRSPNNRNTNRV